LEFQACWLNSGSGGGGGGVVVVVIVVVLLLLLSFFLSVFKMFEAVSRIFILASKTWHGF
jgi:hypothetical protein